MASIAEFEGSSSASIICYRSCFDCSTSCSYVGVACFSTNFSLGDALFEIGGGESAVNLKISALTTGLFFL